MLVSISVSSADNVVFVTSNCTVQAHGMLDDSHRK
jgi:hypothetical protein